MRTDLRRRAEARLKLSRSDVAAMSPEQIQVLVHELQVHQIELQMQHEELMRARADLAEARDRYFDLYEFAPVGYVTVGRDRHIVEANLRATQIAGLERDKLIGMPLVTLVQPEHRDALHLHLTHAMTSGAPQTCELKFSPPTPGKKLVMRLDIMPIEPGSPAAGGCRVTLTDVTAHREAEEALLAAKQAAEDANRAKSQFLSNVSHELRTPMNAILGMLDLALGDGGLSPTQSDYLDTAKQSADSLLVLLNELLDLSRIEAGRFVLETVPFGLRSVVEGTVKTLAVQAAAKGIELVCDLPEDVPDRLIGDPLRLRQVLTNLVGNAIKFTDREAGRGDAETRGHGDWEFSASPRPRVPASAVPCVCWRAFLGP